MFTDDLEKGGSGLFVQLFAVLGRLETIYRDEVSARIYIKLALFADSSTTLRCTRSKGYVTVSMNLIPETCGLSLSEIVHARVIGVIHEVTDS